MIFSPFLFLSSLLTEISMRYNQEGEMKPWFIKTHRRNLEVLALRRQISGQVLPFS